MAVNKKDEKALLFYKRFFLFAFIWNVGAGLLGLISLTFNIKIFYNIANYHADGLFKLHFYNFWSFILIMGIGFYFVSRDVTKNYAMAIVGILGKTLAAGVWLYYYYIGQASFMVIIASAGDMLLVIFFAMYLKYILQNNN